MNSIDRNSSDTAGREFMESVCVDAVVIAVVPEYQLTIVRTDDGRQYSITRHTTGLSFADLIEGQIVRCDVTTRLPRVLRARLLP
jgi:hypothetical protein